MCSCLTDKFGLLIDWLISLSALIVRLFDWLIDWLTGWGSFSRLLQISQAKTDFFVQHNVHPAKSFILPIIQIPLWVCLSFALRNLSTGRADHETVRTKEEFQHGGILWFVSPQTYRRKKFTQTRWRITAERALFQACILSFFCPRVASLSNARFFSSGFGIWPHGPYLDHSLPQRISQSNPLRATFRFSGKVHHADPGSQMVFPIHLVVNHSADGHHAGGESFPTPSAAWVHIPVLSTNPWVEYKSLGWVQILGSSTNPCAEYKSLGWAQILGLSTNPWVEYKSLGWVQILVLFLSSIGLILWIKCAVSCAFSGYFILLASIHAVWIAPIFSPVQPTRPTEPGDTSCRPVKNRRREMVLPPRGCQKNDQQKINRWLCWISSFEEIQVMYLLLPERFLWIFLLRFVMLPQLCFTCFSSFWRSSSAILSSAILFFSEQNISYSRPSHILTVMWLDFYRVVSFLDDSKVRMSRVAPL